MDRFLLTKKNPDKEMIIIECDNKGQINSN